MSAFRTEKDRGRPDGTTITFGAETGGDFDPPPRVSCEIHPLSTNSVFDRNVTVSVCGSLTTHPWLYLCTIWTLCLSVDISIFQISKGLFSRLQIGLKRMSLVKFFPVSWSIDPNWTYVSSIGRTPDRRSVNITTNNSPSLILSYDDHNQADVGKSELKTFLMNGTISEEPTLISNGVYSVSFLNKCSLETFTKLYTGTARIIQRDPLRTFFATRKINPGNWQEINHIKTAPFICESSREFNFYSEDLQSLSDSQEQMVLNLFLVVDRAKSDGSISITVDLSGETRTHVVDDFSTLAQCIREYNPDRIIYYQHDTVDLQGYFCPKTVVIDWSRLSSLDSQKPNDSLELAQFWSVSGGEEIIRKISNFWLSDISRWLCSDQIKELIDLIRVWYPQFQARIYNTNRQGIFRQFWLSPLSNLRIRPGYDQIVTHLGKNVILLLIQIGVYEIPNDTIWIDSSGIATESSLGPESQRQLVTVIVDSDRIYIDSQGNVHRSGLGPLTHPPFKLLDKYFLNVLERLINPDLQTLEVRAEQDDFIITSIISSSLNSVKSAKSEPYSTLTKQVQELGLLPVKYKTTIQYIQTVSGPVLMELVNKNRSKYFSILDYQYYHNQIQEILGKLFPKSRK